MNAEEAIARCQPFWTFVAVMLGIICLVVLVSVIARIILDQRRGARPQGDASYKSPH